MKTIELFEQEGNRSVGIFQEADGRYLAMTYTQSKNFKTEAAARKWIEKYL